MLASQPAKAKCESRPLPRPAMQGITVGRPRDGNDRVAWLADRGRYAEALTVAEEDRTGGRVGRREGSAPVPERSPGSMQRCTGATRGHDPVLPARLVAQPARRRSGGPLDPIPSPIAPTIATTTTKPKPSLPPCTPACAVQPASLEAVGEQFLHALAREERYSEAAALAPRVLKVRQSGCWRQAVHT